MSGSNVQRDILYRHAAIGYNQGQGPMQNIPLKLDAYFPAADTPTAAVVLAHGGVFHRGSKDFDAFSAGIGTNTSIAEYCRRFAAIGIAAFSVQYRLAQTDPEPSPNPVLTCPDEVPMSRVSVLRQEMGLPPIEPREMARFMEAAFDDVAEAILFVKAHHREYNIDAERIVVGGFSAGGRCASYVAYGKRIGVVGVVSISGPMLPADAETYLTTADRSFTQPPLLMISGEHDLDYVRIFTPELAQLFRASEKQAAFVLVPGQNHFYSSESRTEDGRTVFDVIHESTTNWVGQPSRN